MSASSRSRGATRAALLTSPERAARVRAVRISRQRPARSSDVQWSCRSQEIASIAFATSSDWRLSAGASGPASGGRGPRPPAIRRPPDTAPVPGPGGGGAAPPPWPRSRPDSACFPVDSFPAARGGPVSIENRSSASVCSSDPLLAGGGDPWRRRRGHRSHQPLHDAAGVFSTRPARRPRARRSARWSDGRRCRRAPGPAR